MRCFSYFAGGSRQRVKFTVKRLAMSGPQFFPRKCNSKILVKNYLILYPKRNVSGSQNKVSCLNKKSPFA